MPIDPNIAMGVRPIEQPNMLAQMGQMMAPVSYTHLTLPTID
jgi:hypothetical protein